MTQEAKERGQRVRLLRNALRLSRKKFSQHGLPMGTIQNIEDGRYENVADETIQQFAQVFNSLGMSCDAEWIMHGRGQPPQLLNTNLMPISSQSLSVDQQITQELKQFHQNYPNAIDTIVSDDLMAPFVFAGDIVAGERYFGDKLRSVVQHYCIVQTRTGETIVRYIKSRNTKDLFTLIAINPKANSKNKIQKDVAIFSAAPVMWVRRGDPIKNA